MIRRILVILFIILILGLSVGSVAAQNSYSLWFGKYWDNPDQEGDPVATESTGVINFDWGSGPPKSGMPADHWSARWTTYVDFSPGTYRITSLNDDGVMVFLGYKHIISDWNKHPPRTNQVVVSLVGGTYSMAVDFFEDVGGAKMKLSWDRTGPPVPGAADVTIVSSTSTPPPAPPPSQTSWSAAYWNNTNLSGAASLTRNESAINYDWGTGSPAPGTIAADYFSARWTRSIYFESGTYRFTTQSDDGIRVNVGANRIIDNWTTHAVQTNTAEVYLSAGNYTVVVEYFENTHVAVAKFWWEKIGGGTGGPTGVTATTTAYWLNMRSGPGVGYTILTVLPKGTVVPVIGRNTSSTWLQVVHQGQTGWISKAYTTVSGNITSVPITG